MTNASDLPRNRVAVVQSNYVPWKGYFDLIAAVDQFVLYDDVQFTKNDWRNRNRIKTPQGTSWISIPVGARIDRLVREVVVPPPTRWQHQHWKALESNYRRSPNYNWTAEWLAPLYLDQEYEFLSDLNRRFLEVICRHLGIQTRLRSSSEFQLEGDRSERLAFICQQVGATEYYSGPAAGAYLELSSFRQRGVTVRWFSYDGYRPYPQLWGPFVHEVSILDLLFNCGPSAPRFMKFESTHLKWADTTLSST